jgi:hypothetical protein
VKHPQITSQGKVFLYIDHSLVERRVIKTGEPTLYFNPVIYTAVRSVGNDQYFSGIVLDSELKQA